MSVTFRSRHRGPTAAFYPCRRVPTKLKLQVLRYTTYFNFPIDRNHPYRVQRCISLRNYELVQLALEACKCTWFATYRLFD